MDRIGYDDGVPDLVWDQSLLGYNIILVGISRKYQVRLQETTAHELIPKTPNIILPSFRKLSLPFL